jgi:hypothetical protein
MPKKRKQRDRRAIEANLTAAGWLVQSRDELDLTDGYGMAVREFAMFADYLLSRSRSSGCCVIAWSRGCMSALSHGRQRSRERGCQFGSEFRIPND